MSIVLIFPPTWDVSLPYLSLPCLSAYLKKLGVEVCSIDANIESFYFLLETSNLEEVKEYITGKIRNPLDKKHEVFIRRALATCDFIIEKKDEALDFFRIPENLNNYQGLLWASDIIEQTMDLYTARYYPMYFTLYGIINMVKKFNPDEIIDFAENPSYPLAVFYRDRLLPRIEAEKPSIVGFSAISRDQMLHSVYLANLIKGHFPEIHTTIGGCFINVISEKIKRDFYPLGKYFDTVIFGQGEIPLYNLYRIINEKSDYEKDRRNILSLSGKETPMKHCNLSSEYKDFPVPDFSDFPLDKYISNDIMLPYQMASGCYYGKCAFCNSKSATVPDYTAKNPSKVYQDLKELQSRYNCSIFHINDEALNINLFSSIAGDLSGLGLTVFTQARFEKGLDKEKLLKLKKAGIKKIAFGFESGNERVLGLMEKGYDLKDAGIILENCHRLGIEVHLFGIIAFPGETDKEREDTVKFVKNLSSYRKSLMFGYFFHTFLMEYNSKVYRNPSDYGIAEIIDREKFNFYADYRLKDEKEIIDGETFLEIRDKIHKELYDSKPVSCRTPFFSDIVYLHHFERRQYTDIIGNNEMPYEKRFITKTVISGKDGNAQDYIFDLQNKNLFSVDRTMQDIFNALLKNSSGDLSFIAQELGIPKIIVKQKIRDHGFEFLFEKA